VLTKKQIKALESIPGWMEFVAEREKTQCPLCGKQAPKGKTEHARCRTWENNFQAYRTMAEAEAKAKNKHKGKPPLP